MGNNNQLRILFFQIIFIFSFSNFSNAQTLNKSIWNTSEQNLNTTITLDWEPISTATNYSLRYRMVGSPVWIELTTVVPRTTLEGLDPNATYEYQFKANAGSMRNVYSTIYRFHSSNSCGTPTGVTPTSVNSTTENLLWSEISGIMYYNFRYRKSGTSSWTYDSSIVSTKNISGLLAATTYQVQVQTRCTPGLLSPYSQSVTFTTNSATSCGVPTGLSVSSQTSTSALLNWNSVSGANSYSIQYKLSSSSSWTTKTSATNSLSVTGLTSAVTYSFKVSAVCSGASSAYSATTDFSTSVNCGMPNVALFGTTNKTSSSVTVYWTAISGAVSYNVNYRINGTSSAWTTVATSVASAALSGLASGTMYEFQVQTVCTGGASAFSPSGIFTTTVYTCGLVSVSSFTSTAITNTSATVGWTAISGATGYNVQYRIRGSGSAWATASTTTSSKALTGLTSGVTYEFQVQTICSGGNSIFSASGIFTTTSTSCGTPVASTFTSTSVTTTSATLNWPAISSAISYNLQYRITGSGNAWTSATATTNSKALSGLTAGTTYEVQAQTVCSGGTSAFSASGTVTTASISCGSVNVALFTSTNKTASTCTVGWSAVSGATSYTVQYRVVNSGSAWSSISSTTVSANLTGLLSSSQYEFQVQTICSGGVGTFSTSGVFATTAATTNCGLTTSLTVSGITINSAILNWTAVSGSASYNVQYRQSGTTAWTTTTSTTNSKTVTGLNSAAAYEFQVQTVCTGSTSAYSASKNFSTLSVSTAALPIPDHIVVVIFENHSYNQIMGNSAAPHINAFSAETNTTLFTESYGIEHPSQPNYLDLFAGGNQGVTNNVKPASKFTSMNLAAALINAGRTYKSYSDGMPSVGYDGDVSGTYARKHNPLANWVGTGTNQVPSSLNLPFTSFPADFSTLPTVCFVSPDMNNSMHDGSGNTAITNGDNWFYNKIYPYVQWAKTHNSLLIFTFDEDDLVSGNRITTIFSGQMVSQGQNSTGINHYNILRTIEDMYSTAHSGNAANASPIHGCWTNGYRTTTVVPEVASELITSVYPNPATDVINVEFKVETSSDVTLKLIDVTGKKITEKVFNQLETGNYKEQLDIADLHLSKGLYFVDLSVNEIRTVKKILIQ